MWNLIIGQFDFYYIFYTFILYSFFGWIYESCLVSVQHKKWVNRGFLNGPYIPIYGVGATLITVVLTPLRSQYASVFIFGMCMASILEYVTSFLMEKLFHAKWWDYSHIRFNLNGRICLRASLFWGLLSVLVIEFVQPPMDRLIGRIPRRAGEYAGYMLILVFMADLTVTVIYTLQLDKKLTDLQQLRMDINEYFEKSKLYSQTEEWKARLEQSKITELVDSFKEKFEEDMERFIFRLENPESFDKNAFREDFDSRMKQFTGRYQKHSERVPKIQKRLLNAFPNLKARNRESALDELKDRIKKIREERNNRNS